MRYYLKAAETWFYRGIMKTPWGNELHEKTYKGYWLLEQERDNPHSLDRSREGEYWGML